jgi:hypothetical protein
MDGNVGKMKIVPFQEGWQEGRDGVSAWEILWMYMARCPERDLRGKTIERKNLRLYGSWHKLAKEAEMNSVKNIDNWPEKVAIITKCSSSYM